MNQRDAGTTMLRGQGQGNAHSASGWVANEANRIDKFASAARADE